MSLPDVYTQVSDGLLGFKTQKGTGISIKIGASPIVADSPVIITGNMRADKIKERLGLSPLADSVMVSVDSGSSRIYCIPVQASVAGSVGSVQTTGNGDGKLTVSGVPHNAYEVIVEITGKGSLNSALFTWSIDGATTISRDLTVPLTGEFELPDTGLTLEFSDESGSEHPFQIGDTFTFSTQAPQMTNADVLAAIETLQNFHELYELVHIVGESTPAMWTAVSAAQIELEEEYHKYTAFVLEAGRPVNGEKIEDYVFRLEAEKKQLNNRAIQVVAARSLYVHMDGTTREINNAPILMGLYARTEVQQSISRTRDSHGMGIKKIKMLELRPHGIEEYTEILDAANFVTFREYDGLDDYFVTLPRMMCPDGSDYRYMEDIRVLQKIQREIRKEGLQLLHEDIDMTNAQSEMEKIAKYLETPLDEMIDDKEISAAEITVPEGQDITEGEEMEVEVRYVSRGYIRTIRVDIGRARYTA